MAPAQCWVNILFLPMATPSKSLFKYLTFYFLCIYDLGNLDTDDKVIFHNLNVHECLENRKLEGLRIMISCD
jgi:hypothetical protein